MKRFIFIPLFLILFTSLSTAETLNEDQLQERVKQVSKTLRCAVCQSESVWESNAELAIQMRDIIRERLIQGESPDQIRAYFVSRYGDFILLKPRAFGLNLLLWGGPFLLLIIGGTFLFRTLRKWVAETAPASPEELSPIDEKSRRRIEQEIRGLEPDK
ncbi:MAG: cytochrome c-type biogenesis protein CcmH [Candidatus Manganitrophus sp.]|nr:cytochrome c-type biogenesis protein CcmH [Candidatus Manganitrophus sp.]MDC4223487.1 cytochrome c-type biogenesis protein CcmH [Candidatus Manganitrophus sp.]WDT70609.1 MAG: cytochrome c-type biogenesis protein CcmH [Candidatus Manganitrophus sp.]WDT77139.1 MAG: cytochrome c-type biogenesis protein CcmH [Candidatus Manganitrophus sp.]WDT82134.1 MAG: cytochrome c-type biogenesis protein CcmH [Candidatus Manganitrophus sp.]